MGSKAKEIIRKFTGGGGENHLRSRRGKAFLSVLLSIVMVIGLLPVTAFEVRADVQGTVYYSYPKYNDDDPKKGISEWLTGECTEYIVINSGNKLTELTGQSSSTGWYVVDGTVDYGTVTNGITVTGAVNLILLDGCSLTVTGATKKAGICVSGDGNSLTIYAGYTSSDISGSGTLSATGGAYAAGIGGELNANGSGITINGGKVTATGGDGNQSGGGAGIGGGCNANGSGITINGGTVTATGGDGNKDGGKSGGGAAGIGGGYTRNGSSITINGGTVTATGGDGNKGSGAGIGKGCNGSSFEKDVIAASSVAVKAGTSSADTFIKEVTSDSTDITEASKSKRYVRAGVPDYLTFISQEDNSSVTFNWESGSNIQYKKNNDDWAAYNKEKVSLANGDTVSFRGTEVKTNLSQHFSMTGKIAASGSVTSLTDCFGDDPETALTAKCYERMFQSCTSLTSASELKLPATTLAEACYLGMFYGCTSLTSAPVLPATTLAGYCYQDMFYDCVSLMLSDTQTEGSTKWKIPCDETSATSWNYGMFSHTLGTETEPKNGKTYYQQPTPWNQFWNQFADDSYIASFGKTGIDPTTASAVAKARIADIDKSKIWVVFADGTGGKYRTLSIWDAGYERWLEGDEKSDSDLRSFAGNTGNYVYVIGTVGTQTAITGLTLKNDKFVYDNKEKTVEIASVKAGTKDLSETDYTIVESESSKQKATAIGEYTITVSGKGKYSGEESATWYIKKAAPAAPTGLKSFAPSKEGGDGKITGVTDKMEYKINDGDWEDCSGTEITGLDACKVYVRIKETTDTYAGTAAEVIVGAYVGFNVTYELSGKGADWQEERTVEVASGSNAKRPKTDPSETGWTFLGWFESLAETAREWAFDGESGADDFKILKATTIYAKWDQNEYTVTFDSDGGSAVPSATVKYGEKVTKPTDPVKNGYTFEKWTYDDEGTAREWLFDTMTVTEDLTLTATWKKKDDPGSDDGDDNRSTTTTSKPAKTGTWDSPVTDGTWTKGSNGKWMYKTNANFKNTWGYIQYTDRNGVVQTGWFWFDANGYMVTGWVQVNGSWFYFDETEGGTLGLMKQGWITWNGNQYYLTETKDGNGGKMLTNTTTPDGHVVDETGKRIR